MTLMQRLVTIAVIGMLAGGGPALGAQSPTADFRQASGQLKVRDTLRIWAISPALDRRRVIIEGVRGDTLRVIPASGVIDEIRFAAIPESNLTRIDLYVPSGVRRHPVRSGLMGMLIGAVGGALAGALVAHVVGTDEPRTADYGEIGGGALGFLVGGITGTVIGVKRDARNAGTWRTVFAR